jgi:predicted DNA-binding antitoxin AbrB/MazE fold protein
MIKIHDMSKRVKGRSMPETAEAIFDRGVLRPVSQPFNLKDGQRVRLTLEPIAELEPDHQTNCEPKGDFFHPPTIDELAAAQGVRARCSFDDLLGGWPEEDKEDGIEEAMADWRKEDARRARF